MIPAWSRRIERAEELAKTCAPAAEMLRLYAEIARFQKTIYEQQPSDVLPYLPGNPAPLVPKSKFAPAVAVETVRKGVRPLK